MTAQAWLEAYAQSHQDPVNKAIHAVCVPLITVALVSLLSLLPFPGKGAWWHAGTLALGAAMMFYVRLSRGLAVGMALAAVLTLVAAQHLGGLGLLPVCAVFVVAWVGQFVGHRIEGKKPSFFTDLQFLLIGPLWLVAAAYRRLGIPC